MSVKIFVSKNIFQLMLGSCLMTLLASLVIQYLYQLNPCPLCIIQRMALIALMLIAFLGCVTKYRRTVACLAGLTALFGGGVGAWHHYLQSHPLDFATCTPGFHFILDNFSLVRALPLLFHGTGLCMLVDWTMLGLTLPEWSLAFFSVMLGLACVGFFSKPVPSRECTAR